MILDDLHFLLKMAGHPVQGDSVIFTIYGLDPDIFLASVCQLKSWVLSFPAAASIIKLGPRLHVAE